MTTRLLKMDEVAEKIGASRYTVYRRIEDGTLPKPVKVGGLTRWIEGEVEAALAALAEARGAA